MIFFFFQKEKKKGGGGVSHVHPTVVSVLLPASVERCFVSGMQDFSSPQSYRLRVEDLAEIMRMLQQILGHKKLRQSTNIKKLNSFK